MHSGVHGTVHAGLLASLNRTTIIDTMSYTCDFHAWTSKIVCCEKGVFLSNSEEVILILM